VRNRTDQVSDAERERTVESLKAHTVAGRLTAEELAARTETAHAARTAGELAETTRGLPALPRPPFLTRTADRIPLRTHVGAYVVVSAVLVVVWAATRDPDPGATDEAFGLLWPFWIMLAWGVVLVAHALYALRRPAFRRVSRRAG
jgi:uncharacterized protein DUF1707/2TM domain-containing protein